MKKKPGKAKARIVPDLLASGRKKNKWSLEGLFLQTSRTMEKEKVCRNVGTAQSPWRGCTLYDSTTASRNLWREPDKELTELEGTRVWGRFLPASVDPAKERAQE